MIGKPKILMICPWLDHNSSSKGMVFREQARLLAGQFDITFLSFQKLGFKDLGISSRIISFKEHFEPKTNEKYIYVHYLNSSYLGDVLNNWIEKMAVNKVISYFSKHAINFELVHAQCLRDSGVFGFYLKQKLGIPYIITEHAQICLVGVSVKRHKHLQNVLDHASKRLLVSNHKMAQYASNRLYGDFETIGNMVNENVFNAKNPPSKTNEYYQLTTLGAFSPIKDQGTILKALMVLDKYPMSKKIRFTWAGFDAWVPGKESAIRHTIEGLHLKQIDIQLLASVGRKEVAAILRKSDLFLFSSLAEGMPLAVMEALACGVPVISTKWGGADEIINEKNGRLIDFKDYSRMAEYVINTFENPSLFDPFEISEEALQNFGSGVFKGKMADIYLDALN